MASKESMARGVSLSSGKGMCSYSKNPMPAASRTSSQCGPGLNPDQRKSDKLLKAAFSSKESLRGQTGF